MNQDSIPIKDTDFNNWVVPFAAYVVANATTLNVSPDQSTALNTAVTVWTTAYGVTQNSATATTTATTAKNEARAALEAILRPLIKQLQANPAVTDDMRAAMGIHVSNHTHTHVAVPATAPVLSVDFSTRLEHVISFRDSAAPHSRARPDGVTGCEIWSKVGGPAPVDNSTMAYLTTQPHTPYLIAYTGAQAGQMVYYLARWVNTRGEKGPWSAVVSAVIAG